MYKQEMQPSNRRVDVNDPYIAFGAWREKLPNEVVDPGHIETINGIPSIPVRLYGPKSMAPSEPTNDLSFVPYARENVIFNNKPESNEAPQAIVPAKTDGSERQIKTRKARNTTGLEGFYKGTYYRNGVAQRSRKNGRNNK